MTKVPDDFQEFKLTMDGSNQRNGPMELLNHAASVEQKGKWTFIGKALPSRIVTRTFRLVTLHPAADIHRVNALIFLEAGQSTEGQWIKAFAERFSQPHPERGTEPIGIADPSWKDPHGIKYFPWIIHRPGNFGFYPVSVGPFHGWRWLIKISVEDIWGDDDE